MWLFISHLGLFIFLDMLFIQLFLRNKLQDKYYLIVILLFVFSSCVRFNAAVISCPYSSSVMSLSASALSWGQRQKSHTGRLLIRCPQCRRKALKRRWRGTRFFFLAYFNWPIQFSGGPPTIKILAPQAGQTTELYFGTNRIADSRNLMPPEHRRWTVEMNC